MKWAITGGSGQLARSLINLLSEAAIPHFAWNHVELDVSDPISIPKILEFQPSVLVNCAAWTNVEEAEDSYEKALKVNQDGVRNVATAARELDIPLIHISTDYVFSGFSTKPWRIDDLTQPIFLLITFFFLLIIQWLHTLHRCLFSNLLLLFEYPHPMSKFRFYHLR